jgi:hypothetical protein
MLKHADSAKKDFDLRADFEKSHEATMSNVVQTYRGE